MILSAAAIREAIAQGTIGITPFDETRLKEASYTFTLGRILQVPGRQPGEWQKRTLDDAGYSLAPGQFVLATTAEAITLSRDYACFLSGRGSVAQQGLDALQSSIFAEPLSAHVMILETSNHGPWPVTLKPGMLIAKGIFTQVSHER